MNNIKELENNEVCFFISKSKGWLLDKKKDNLEVYYKFP
jgi:hypothetical protein